MEVRMGCLGIMQLDRLVMSDDVFVDDNMLAESEGDSREQLMNFMMCVRTRP